MAVNDEIYRKDFVNMIKTHKLNFDNIHVLHLWTFKTPINKVLNYNVNINSNSLYIFFSNLTFIFFGGSIFLLYSCLSIKPFIE